MHRWKGKSMVSLDIMAFTSICNGTDENGLEGPIIIFGLRLGRFVLEIVGEMYEVKDGGVKLGNRQAFLMCNIACHRKGFEINFRSHDRTSKVQ